MSDDPAWREPFFTSPDQNNIFHGQRDLSQSSDQLIGPQGRTGDNYPNGRPSPVSGSDPRGGGGVARNSSPTSFNTERRQDSLNYPMSRNMTEGSEMTPKMVPTRCPTKCTERPHPPRLQSLQQYPQQQQQQQQQRHVSIEESHFSPIVPPVDAFKNTRSESESSTGSSDGSGRTENKSSMMDGPYPNCDFLVVRSRSNLDDDSVSWHATFQSFIAPVVIERVYFACKQLFLGVLPALILSNHPNVKHFFPGAILLPILPAIMSRPFLGQQIMVTIMLIQAVTVIMVWGVFLNAVGAHQNVGAWWCAALFGPFVVSLFGDLPAKRMAMIFMIIIMLTEYLHGGTAIHFPCNFAKDLYLSTALAIPPCLFPFPRLAATEADGAIASVLNLIGQVVHCYTEAVWSTSPVDSRVHEKRAPMAAVNEKIGVARAFIRDAAYEPLEFSLKNHLRECRIGMIRKLMVLLYSSNSVVSATVHSKDRTLMKRNKGSLFDYVDQRLSGPTRELVVEMRTVLNDLGKTLLPEETVKKVNYTPMYKCARFLEDTVDAVRLEILSSHHRDAHLHTTDFLRIFCYHQTLLDMVEEIENFALSMENFDRSKTKSTMQRAYEFCFLEQWNDFWAELPKRVTLATPRDVRLVKDGIKFSLAFAVAAAITLHLDSSNIYYFAMAILMGIAQQTAAETLKIGVQRICGLAMGITMSYIAVTRADNVAELITIIAACCFVGMCFMNHQEFGNTATYFVISSITGESAATSAPLLVVRVVDATLIFIFFFLICVMVFPLDPIRVLSNLRIKTMIAMMTVCRNIAELSRLTITLESEQASALLDDSGRVLQQILGLLLQQAMWMPKASSEPTIRGGVYPVAAVNDVFETLKRLTSSIEVYLVAWTRIHRPRVIEPNPLLNDVLSHMMPGLQGLNCTLCVVLQDLIDSVEDPRHWSQTDTLAHFQELTKLKVSFELLMRKVQSNFFGVYSGAVPVDSSEFVGAMKEMGTNSKGFESDPTRNSMMNLSFSQAQQGGSSGQFGNNTISIIRPVPAHRSTTSDEDGDNSMPTGTLQRNASGIARDFVVAVQHREPPTTSDSLANEHINPIGVLVSPYASHIPSPATAPQNVENVSFFRGGNNSIALNHSILAQMFHTDPNLPTDVAQQRRLEQQETELGSPLRQTCSIHINEPYGHNNNTTGNTTPPADQCSNLSIAMNDRVFNMSGGWAKRSDSFLLVRDKKSDTLGGDPQQNGSFFDPNGALVGTRDGLLMRHDAQAVNMVLISVELFLSDLEKLVNSMQFIHQYELSKEVAPPPRIF